MKSNKNFLLVSHILAPYQYEVIKELKEEYINLIFYGPSHLSENIDPIFKFFSYGEENQLLIFLKSLNKKSKLLIHSFSNNIYSFIYPYQLHCSLKKSKLLINYHSDGCGDNYFFNWNNGWEKINFKFEFILRIKLLILLIKNKNKKFKDFINKFFQIIFTSIPNVNILSDLYLIKNEKYMNNYIFNLKLAKPKYAIVGSFHELISRKLEKNNIENIKNIVFVEMDSYSSKNYKVSLLEHSIFNQIFEISKISGLEFIVLKKSRSIKKEPLFNPYLKSIKKIYIKQSFDYISNSIFIVPCDSGFNIEFKSLEKRIIRYNIFNSTGLIDKECSSYLIKASEIKCGYSYNLILEKINEMISCKSINKRILPKEVPEYTLKLKEILNNV